MMMKRFILLFLLSLLTLPALAVDSFAWQKLSQFASTIEARPAGSQQEIKALNWLINEFAQLGYQGTKTDFDFDYQKVPIRSSNYEVTIKGQSEKTIIIGAHYDSVKNLSGVTGFIDNASGAVTLIALAHALKDKTLPYTIKLIAFGAEEVGLQGAKAYVKSSQFDKQNTIAMINLDTVIGGDYLYVHSAHSTPYNCDYITKNTYNFDTWVRDELHAASKKLYGKQAHKLHPANEGYPMGETGGWSDHAPFACSGIPIAHIEATNFQIYGQQGQDGYSQSTDKAFWSCFNDKTLGPCDKSQEKYWGMIWHTKFDQPSQFIPKFEQHIKQQFEQNVAVITEFVVTAKQ